ncbi:ATP-binding cassette domain-containing protein [Bifidobacterium sp. ESL0745]|uniref:ATP-binding cassette domain-containing protein n=1 Tax=Bifidobacterium sp. ESL0745 TaxID=2983226 RepID=UPI0023F8BA6C|nr:ATP-binding cassette domain-containing protein [Bifidobacterium sp. ESL0745]MDF7665798.1 ATP-binding cassette domain-containing protein [Bifidobacterium sp. ESL0745]
MSKNTDSKDEAMNNDPDNMDDNATDTSADASAVQYDVVFDDDENALDLGALATAGQIDDAVSNDDTDDADSDGNGGDNNAGNEDKSENPAETKKERNTKKSNSAASKASGNKTDHTAKRTSSAKKSNTSEAEPKEPNSEDTSEADKETDGDKATPDNVATSNAQHVNETIGLAAPEEDELIAHEAKSAAVEPATAVSTRLDKETITEADILLKPNPTFALDHVTLTNRKTGRNVLDNIDWGFFAGSLYAITGADDEQRRALLAVASGFYRADSGQVMVKSQSLLELETNEIRGHRIGLITQRYSLRDDLDALTNLTFTMRASGRTFLKPIPEAARDILKYVDFDEAATGVKVPELKPVNQRRLAIARAICCEATVVLADDPLGGLDTSDRSIILDLLARIAHTQDPKRCVIVLVPGFGAETSQNDSVGTGENDDAEVEPTAEAIGNSGRGTAKTEAETIEDSDEYSDATDYEVKADKIYSF